MIIEIFPSISLTRKIACFCSRLIIIHFWRSIKSWLRIKNICSYLINRTNHPKLDKYRYHLEFITQQHLIVKGYGNSIWWNLYQFSHLICNVFRDANIKHLHFNISTNLRTFQWYIQPESIVSSKMLRDNRM